MNHVLDIKDCSVGTRSKNDTPTAMSIYKLAGEVIELTEKWSISNIEKLTVLSAAKAIIEAMALNDDYKSLMNDGIQQLLKGGR